MIRTSSRLVTLKEVAARLGVHVRTVYRMIADGQLPKRGTGFLRADLKRAGIAFTDERGDKLDFHAFRHTAATWAGATGVAGPMLQAFTAHKDARQVERYVHGKHLPMRAVVEKLPAFKVGTNDGTEIGTAEMVQRGHGRSSAVATAAGPEVSQVLESSGVCQAVAGSVTASQEGEKQWAIQGSNLWKNRISDTPAGDGTVIGTVVPPPARPGTSCPTHQARTANVGAEPFPGVGRPRPSRNGGAFPADLQQVIDTWPRLTRTQRASVLAVLRSFTNGKDRS